jgi:dGTPase
MGRKYDEPEDDMRFPFQRDRDRIIHAQAFRRLKGKTQVFLAGTHDHVRTRLTHTLEVTQIARDIARALRLNEDLTECIALAHDLGHPPFGHAGEEALDRWMKKTSVTPSACPERSRRVVEGFEHNAQSHRIVTVLAEHSTLFPGLNLSGEILEGILKHRTPHYASAAQIHESPLRGFSLEAQVVNLADEIAYTGHDCEDGLRAELFTREQIQMIPLVTRAIEMSAPRGTSLRGALIHILVHDLLRQTQENIERANIRSLDAVYATQHDIVCFSKTLQKNMHQLREFLWKSMYLHSTVTARSHEGQKIVLALCDYYMITHDQRIEHLMKRTGSALPEAIKDYVSGMTDAYALQQMNMLSA